MSLPILQPNSTPNLPQVRGEVDIDPSVIIASGVILNATPGNKITIHPGVCLGMGTIITAHEGDVEIKANAILGPGTLILGSCVIGSQASLGTSVTIYHANVENLAVIPAGSIIGDYSRKLDVVADKAVVVDKSEEIPRETENQDQYSESSIIDKINQLNKNKHSSRKTPSLAVETTKNLSSEKSDKDNLPQDVVDKVENGQESINSHQKEDINHSNKQSVFTDKEKQKEEKSDRQKSSEEQNTEESNSSSEDIVEKKEVVGKVYINRLLYTLFPEKNYRKK